jgi:hypothetical protein
MIDPKLQKLIDKLKANDAAEFAWLERNGAWLACMLSFVMGVVVGRLVG